MSLRVDLHTHSNCSDGALSVQDLLSRALDADIHTLALTDHDTVTGYDVAVQCLSQDSQSSMRLVPGTELSCVWQGITIHVVGLNFDPNNADLRAYFEHLDQARSERAALIAQRLSKEGFEGALMGAQALAGEAQVGRPHFARWMVDAGHCDSMNTAFKRWLGRGKLGDVKVFWPTLEQAVTVLVKAGGVPVLAHPQHYGLTRAKLKRLVSHFVSVGGQALELPLGQDHAEAAVYVRRLLREFGLSVSLGSDFHADSEWGPRLGLDTAIVSDLNPVWAGW